MDWHFYVSEYSKKLGYAFKIEYCYFDLRTILFPVDKQVIKDLQILCFSNLDRNEWAFLPLKPKHTLYPCNQNEPANPTNNSKETCIHSFLL